MHAGIEIGIWAIAILLVASIIFKIRRDKRIAEESNDTAATSGGGEKKESDAQQ